MYRLGKPGKKSAFAFGCAAILYFHSGVAQTRLEGLDRIYFVRIADDASLNSPELLRYIPAILQGPAISSKAKAASDEESPETPRVRDFPLSAAFAGDRLLIREVVVWRNPRIARLYWALYDNGRRSDVWSFEALPSLNDGKILANYFLFNILAPSKDELRIQLRGEMFRPGGFWSVKGIELTFKSGGKAIALAGVYNAFSFLQGYNDDSLTISTERVMGDRIENRTMDSVPKNVLSACQFTNPTIDEHWEYSWERLHAIAGCITNNSVAKIAFRGKDVLSFIERKR